MASNSRKIRDEVMLMTIAVNSDPAQEAMYKLRKENVEYTKSIEELEKKKALLIRRNKENAVEWDKLTAEIKANKDAIIDNSNKMESMRRAMDINQMTMGQLRKEASLLKRQLSEIVPNSNLEQQKKLNQRLQAVNSRMQEVDMGAKQTSNSFRNLADRFNHYSGIVTAVMAVLIGFGVSVKSVIDRNNEMADTMTGVEKKAQMTKTEVEDLTRAFSDFDTRTKKIDLLKMAEIGGSLGVAKSELLDFTREIDKVYVALGDSWKGSVEDLANQLGKIANGFSETNSLPVATAINQIGSALNELAANGTATEQNVADFTRRISALPEELRPAIHEVLGLGAAFEENNIDAERSATALSSFLTTAGKETKRFAEVMQIPVDKVKELINNSPAEFFLQFSEGIKGMDATQLSETLDYLKLNDTYVQSIVGAAANNTKNFRDAIELSNQAISEGTSLQEEFNKVNNNAAAIWEKLQKKIAGFFTSEFVAKGLNGLINAFALFAGVNETAESKLDAFGKTVLTVVRVIGVLAVGIFSTNAAIVAYNLLLKESIARTIAMEAITKVQTSAMAVQNSVRAIWNGLVGSGIYWTGKLTQAIGVSAGSVKIQTAAINMGTAAQQRFNEALKANPIGIIITLIGLAVTAFLAYKSTIDDTAKKQKTLNEIMREGHETVAQDITQLKVWYTQATNVNLAIDQREKAVRKLQEAYPQHFGNVEKEIIMNGKAKQSYYDLRNAILASARARAAENELEKRETERFKETEDWKRIYAEEVRELARLQKVKKEVFESDRANHYRRVEMTERVIQQEEKLKRMEAQRFLQIQNEIKQDKTYIDAITKNQQAAGSFGEPSTNSSTFTPVSSQSSSSVSSSNKNKADSSNPVKSQVKEMLKELDAAKEATRKVQQEITDARIDAMEEGFEREMTSLLYQHEKRIEEIQSQKKSQLEFDDLEDRINKATGDEKIILNELKATWVKKNKELEALKKQEIIKHQIEKNTLYAKNDLKNVQDNEKSHKTRLAQLEREKNNELASYGSFEEMKEGLRKYYSDKELRGITNWNEGKQALDKAYKKQELDELSVHLQEMLKMYEGLDLSILTPEQKEIVIQQLEEVKNKLAEVGAAKKNIANGEEEGLGGKGKLNVGGQNTDILGMSMDDWDIFTSNLAQGKFGLEELAASVQLLQNAFSAYYQFVQANEQAQLREIETNAKRKENRIKRMLDQGVINQEQYETAIDELNRETEMKKWKLEYEAAKRQKVIQIGQTIANTAQAIMGIWAQFPKFDFGATAGIMSGVVGALGALQVATILRQPLPEAPGFEQGFGMEYPMRRSQDGKVFNVVRKPLRSGEVYRPTNFIAGENGVELVIDSPTYTRFRPEVRRILSNEIAYSRGNSAPGYEDGFGTYPYLKNSDKNRMENNSDSDDRYAEAIENLASATRAFSEKDFRAYLVRDMENAKKIIEDIEEYNNYVKDAKR